MIPAHAPLAAEQIGQIRAELLRSLSRLERSLKISGEGARPRDLEQDTVGRLSRIELLQTQGLLKSLEDRERSQIVQIADALRRIEDGTFGTCGACGGPIPFDRLMIYPETRTCTACATRA
jgi:DnaK suppressor protein